ncbi:Spermidine export protein MdtI [Salmonella sp. NCTC 11881]|nr:Spermidine export protein MdtI [Salmonella sp. NCTC 11881]
MQQFEWIHGAWLGLAIMLEIAANVLLKFSDGFRRKCYGILSLAAVLAAFSALSQAVKRDRPVGGVCAMGRFLVLPLRWRRAGCSSASA